MTSRQRVSRVADAWPPRRSGSPTGAGATAASAAAAKAGRSGQPKSGSEPLAIDGRRQGELLGVSDDVGKRERAEARRGHESTIGGGGQKARRGNGVAGSRLGTVPGPAWGVRLALADVERRAGSAHRT